MHGEETETPYITHSLIISNCLILQSITLITFCSPSNLLEFQTNFQCSNGEMENKRLNGFLPSNETNDPSAISIVTIYGDISSTYPVIPLVALPPAKWFPDVNCIFNRIDRWKKTTSLTPSFCKVKKDPSLPWKETRNLSNHSWKYLIDDLEATKIDNLYNPLFLIHHSSLIRILTKGSRIQLFQFFIFHSFFIFRWLIKRE